MLFTPVGDWSNVSLIKQDRFANAGRQCSNPICRGSFGFDDLGGLVLGLSRYSLAVDGDLCWETLVEWDSPNSYARPGNLLQSI